MALLEAFEETHPEVGAAVGADLDAEVLEVTFCASGPSLDAAAKQASEIFVEAAIASGLEPANLTGFEVEIDLSQKRRAVPLVRRRRGAEAWQPPKLLQTAG